MAISVRSLLYDWFGVTLRKPTHQQFINLIDSFWHKSEDAIPIENIDNLQQTLAVKADLVGGIVPDSQLPVFGAVWGNVTGDIGNQTDLVTLLNLFADANLIIELNTTSPSGCLADVTVFSSALLSDNPDLVINSYIIDGRFVKINCRGLDYLSASLFSGNTEIVSIKDFSGIRHIFASCFQDASLVNANFIFVERILDSAFKNCTSLDKVYFPKLQVIQDSFVFKNTAIRFLTFPELISIGFGAFEDCNSLENVILPSATVIGTSAFLNCTLLDSINLPSAYRISGNAFKGCVLLTKAFLPSVIDMGNNVFIGCVHLVDLIVLQTFSSVSDIETDNSITAKILAN